MLGRTSGLRKLIDAVRNARSAPREQHVGGRSGDEASWTLAADVDVAAVAKVLGHRTPATTLGVYAHAMAASDSKAVACYCTSLSVHKLHRCIRMTCQEEYGAQAKTRL